MGPSKPAGYCSGLPHVWPASVERRTKAVQLIGFGPALYHKKRVLFLLRKRTGFQHGVSGSCPAISGLVHSLPSKRDHQILTSRLPSLRPPNQADRNFPGSTSTMV